MGPQAIEGLGRVMMQKGMEKLAFERALPLLSEDSERLLNRSVLRWLPMRLYAKRYR